MPDIPTVVPGPFDFLDGEVGTSIHNSLKALLEESYLYRNREVAIGGIVDEAIATAEDGVSRERLRTDLESMVNGSWDPKEHHIFGNHSPVRDMPRSRRSRQISFNLPTIETWCDTCGKEVHGPAGCQVIFDQSMADEYDPGKQIYAFSYQCHKCKAAPLVFLVRRNRLKLQLTGRSSPFFGPVPSEIPKPLRSIYRDALASVACGDVSAGIYHLRTLVEHQMKSSCGLELGARIDGVELCEKYNASIDPVVSQRASLTSVFNSMSAKLHGRDGIDADFEQALQLITNHFGLVATLAKLGQR
jgi:hypothetical protein